MLIVTCIVGYLIIGAYLAIKDNELVEKHILRGVDEMSVSQRRVYLTFTVTLLMIILPILSLTLTIGNIIFEIKMFRIRRKFEKELEKLKMMKWDIDQRD